MEWVEVTAKSVDEAKELALDQLGVAADDAEFEVLEEPKQGLFGRTRGQARVRARVRPAAVRPKRDRRERGRRDRKSETATAEPGTSAATATVTATVEPVADAPAAAEPAPTESAARSNGRRRNGRSRNGAGEGHNDSRGERPARKEGNVSDEQGSSVNPDEVGAAAATFVTGLAEAFGSPATSEVVTDGTDIEVRLTGENLGLLIGPGGRTLAAIQDLARVAAQRRLGDHETRLKIDVAGYREKRRQALEKFARTVAADVIATGRPKALEPMSSADRKTVHDALAGMEGVTSRSDGQDPARRVVISPA